MRISSADIFCSRSRFFIVGTALLLTLAAPGCARDESGPREVFQQFLSDVWRGNAEGAVRALSPDTVEQLKALWAEFYEGATIVAEDDTPDYFIVTRVDSPFDIRRVDILDSQRLQMPDIGQELDLQIDYFDGRKGRATMVWGGERWYVKLPVPTEPADDDRSIIYPSSDEVNDVQNTDEQPANDLMSDPS